MASRIISEAEALENLANAVVLQAVQDYKNTYKKHLENPFDAEYRNRVEEQRKFFLSGRFAAFTTVSGEYVLESIERECKEGQARQIKHMYTRKEPDWWK